MRPAITLWVLGAMALAPSIALGQADQIHPHIGFAYPAGGRQGSVVRVMVGGQNLNRVDGIHFTGAGVHAVVVRYMGRIVNLNGDERRELQRQLAALEAKTPAPEPEVELPKHPLLENLASLGPEELEFVKNELLRRDPRKQMNSQLADTVLIEVTVDAAAAPGGRELRLETAQGLSNPLRFEVGLLPEMLEPEPYERASPDGEPFDLPMLVNGQVRPGDVDHFAFRAQAGQRLVLVTHARRLVPFLADAVPGWFQATLTLADSTGKEIARADDRHFDPDPVLFFEVPRTDVYRVEIKDAIYRGREDFVYRLAIAEQPFVTTLFPAGGRAGEETVAAIDGWHLETKELALDTRPGGAAIRWTTATGGGLLSNEVAYAVGDLPERQESEPNDSIGSAQAVETPGVVNGRIGTAGDVDVFRFQGKAGEEVVVEVVARRLGSPVDSLVRLLDASGELVAWNDDHADVEGHLHRDMGLATHAADSLLAARLPAGGAYHVEISDAQRQGGLDRVYRLRIGPPRPDFDLFVTPSTINVVAGVATVVDVHVSRREGFDGEVEVVLENPPPGFRLRGGLVPRGGTHVRMTLTAPSTPPAEPVLLSLAGRARLLGAVLERRAIPAEDMMQAFLYRHLVPCRELVVAVIGTKARVGPIEVALEGPLRIRAGSRAEVKVAVPGKAPLVDLEFALSEPPEGVVLESSTVTTGGMTFVFAARPDAAAGLAGNLIVEVVLVQAERRGNEATGKKRRIPVGVLPAIPFQVVER